MRNILREERHKKGMTQKQVADLLGISERGYKFIEYGQRTGSIEIMYTNKWRLIKCQTSRS